jgi:hypothetical protein
MAISRQIGTHSFPIGRIDLLTRRGGLLDRYFYFFMSLLIAVVVAYGFSHTVSQNLLHAAVPRPLILYFHAAIFSGWVLFFIIQSTLVRTHNTRLHRQIGWFGVALGIAIPLVGVSTAVTMARFNIVHFHATDAKSFLIIPLYDMVAFTIPFALAIYWRKKSELHRRLLLIATCALTSAGFGRFPPYVLPHVWLYGGVDLLVLLGVGRDLAVNRRIHAVYLCALPVFILCQIVVMYTMIHNSPYWLRIASVILR